MKIIIYFTEEQASRKIEDPNENIQEAYRLAIKEIANILEYAKIEYLSIDIEQE